MKSIRLSSFLPFIFLSTQLPTGTAHNSSINEEILEKWQNATEPSYLYVVQLELKTSRVEEPFAEIEKRLDKLVATAFALSSYKHRKQNPPNEIMLSDLLYSTRVIKKRTTGDLTYIHFVTYAGNEPVLGEVVADDLTLLTVSQISATLRYPLGRIVSDRDIENESATKWWFLIAVIGTGVLMVIIGWFILFIFYNTCGYSYGTDEEDCLTDMQRNEGRKEFIINTESQDSGVAAEQPIGVPSGSSIPIDTTGKPKLNKKTARSMRPLPLGHLESRLNNEAENFEFGKTVAVERETAADTRITDVERAKRIVKSEKKRRHPKIEPITTTTFATTTTTNEQGKKRGASEISRVSSSSETMSTPEEDEFDVANLPETSLKFVKKGKYRKDSDVRSEPESDYGSSLDEEKPTADDIDEKEKVDEDIEAHHEDTRVRPMTAKTQRTSLFGGNGISPIPTQPRAWTVYSAGDKVAAFWNMKSMNSHPAPSSPTENGFVEIKSTSALRY